MTASLEDAIPLRARIENLLAEAPPHVSSTNIALLCIFNQALGFEPNEYNFELAIAKNIRDPAKRRKPYSMDFVLLLKMNEDGSYRLANTTGPNPEQPDLAIALDPHNSWWRKITPHAYYKERDGIKRQIEQLPYFEDILTRGKAKLKMRTYPLFTEASIKDFLREIIGYKGEFIPSLSQKYPNKKFIMKYLLEHPELIDVFRKQFNRARYPGSGLNKGELKPKKIAMVEP